MRPELHAEVLRILEELSTGEKTSTSVSFKDDKLKDEAIQLLKEHGALQGTNFYNYRITLSGYDYYHRLRAPLDYWLRKNWFPIGVLGLTFLALIVNVTVELID